MDKQWTGDDWLSVTTFTGMTHWRSKDRYPRLQTLQHVWANSRKVWLRVEFDLATCD